jgi:chromate transporter
LFALGVGVIALLRLPEVVVMLAGGLLYALYQTGRSQIAAGLLLMLWQPAAQTVTTMTPTLLEIFAYFLRIGAVLFGSGYLLVAYIQQDVVNTFGWLNTQQLIDAIAIGQTTPGPVLTTTAAVGYIVAGLPGALVAGLGIFLPSFVFVILSAPLITRMRESKLISAFLSGVNAIVVAAILVTLVDLTRVALLTPDGAQFSLIALIMALAALVAIIRFKVNTTWLIAGGGILGLLLGNG